MVFKYGIAMKKILCSTQNEKDKKQAVYLCS